jgi:hypothetical protein
MMKVLSFIFAVSTSSNKQFLQGITSAMDVKVCVNDLTNKYFTKSRLEENAKAVFLEFSQNFCPDNLGVKIPSK